MQSDKAVCALYDTYGYCVLLGRTENTPCRQHKNKINRINEQIKKKKEKVKMNENKTSLVLLCRFKINEIN